MTEDGKIIDPTAGDNGDGKKEPEVLKHCDTCKFWMPLMVTPDKKYAFGGCTNSVCEQAPFGVMMMNYGGCEGWELKPVQTIVQVPAGALQGLNKGKPNRIRNFIR